MAPQILSQAARRLGELPRKLVAAATEIKKKMNLAENSCLLFFFIGLFDFDALNRDVIVVIVVIGHRHQVIFVIVCDIYFKIIVIIGLLNFQIDHLIDHGLDLGNRIRGGFRSPLTPAFRDNFFYEFNVAFGANCRCLLHIVKLCTTSLAGSLDTPFGLRHLNCLPS